VRIRKQRNAEDAEDAEDAEEKKRADGEEERLRGVASTRLAFR
jgi:hypothetical protein